MLVLSVQEEIKIAYLQVMAHPLEDEVWPEDTVIRHIKTGEFAIIRKVVRHTGGKFQYYLVEREGREGQFCALHDEWELEALPKK